MHAWSRKILGEYISAGRLVHLQREEVTAVAIARELIRKDIALVIFNAHGNENQILGYENQVLIESDATEHLLEHKIVHALACRSGSRLASKSIDRGGRAYIGYKEDFKASCLYVRTMQAQQEDPLAELSYVPAFLPVKLLLDGKTVGEAYHASQEAYKASLRKAVAKATTDPLYGNVGVLSRLLHNLENQICIGDHSATL